VHRVQAGETLWHISQTYEVPIDTLLQENGIDDPAQIFEGEALFIPGKLKPPPEQQRRKSPAAIARAGTKPLDPAAHGEALAWPTPGVIISGFGTRERDKHEGIDLAAPEGSPVCAAEKGTVLFAGEQRGYGNLVLVEHAGNLVTVYAHNAENLVKKGDRVTRGEPIARVGHTGNATGPHLHFEVRVGTSPHDPLGFLR
jgi:murein DD-endopeptidase MepM/ murein hydrolase activator NlpD